MVNQLIKSFIDEKGHKINIFRDYNTGIATVQDRYTGLVYSPHPNISVTGSIRGMKSLGYWGKKDKIVRSHGCYYNITRCAIFDKLDKLAAQYCKCGGNHGE